MTPKLTAEMRQALQQTDGQHIRVEDEQTHIEYVLLPLSIYERVQTLFSDDSFDVRDMYAAQSAATRKPSKEGVMPVS